MKNKWELLYNPFTKIAGWKALVVGTVIVCATVVMGYYNHAYFSVLQIKMALHPSLWQCFAIQATGLLSLILLMYLVSLFFVKRVRLQDVAGMALLSRFPYLFLLPILFYFSPVLESIVGTTQENLSVEDFNESISVSGYLMLLLFAALVLLLLGWNIVLLYHAFKVSTGIKGRKTGILLAGIIILSEIIIFLLTPLFRHIK
ncbi:MAG: hypothetical protein LBB85_07705 [Dysgonamonadaceae bacterium]|jgi:hypothetical protein|nr:hypothetical protein [Dysgonamonadaceae bacterium]